ncbi:General stress protein 16O [Anatilimnocola aggregata]|uniref:General stress protein 16O n=1 Tax=Anatilimnocola aggregata TaxID=2528021 RepID=A0A517Y879_9BACT|nr:TraR/DksA C4-type zinc finger protein [Anatilimnocola aggregata]QDU26447.1 General stress protein 16O [Anatilimnocola aggregata]
MKTRDLEHFREELVVLRDRLLGVVSAVTDQTRQPSGGQGDSELSNAPMHLADMGTEEYLHDLNATLLENEEQLVAEVRDAIARIDAGTFGVCDNCDQAIARERLQAMPFVKHCVVCAEAIDHSETVNFNRGRPSTPRDTLAPEGEMNENRSRTSQRPLSEISADAGEEFSDDSHAVGTAGGGTAVGGLAGTNIGRGDPSIADLQDASGSSDFDRTDARDDNGPVPHAARNGVPIRGTPKSKRTR